MKRKLVLGSVFIALLAAGAMSASAVAGQGPLSILGTSSTSTTGSTTTGSSSTSSTSSTTGSTSTGSTSTGTTTTTATTTTNQTSTTTTTTPKPKSKAAKITICAHFWPKRGAVKHVTKKVNRTAWNAYKKRGASLGACNTAAAKKFHSKPAHIKRFHHR